MKTYKITITDEFFKLKLTGQFEAKTKKQAIDDCLDFYSYELDTIPEAIKILDIKLLKEVSI